MPRVAISELTTFEKGGYLKTAANRKVYIYETGTTTPILVYDAQSGGALVDQPLLSDSDGRLRDYWAAEPGTVDVVDPSGAIPLRTVELVAGIDQSDVPTKSGAENITGDWTKNGIAFADVSQVPPLTGSAAIEEMASEAAMTGQSITRTTGISSPTGAGAGSVAATAAALINAADSGSHAATDMVWTEPLYTAPRRDPIYRITGPFRYLFDSSAQHVGAFAIGRTDSNPAGGQSGATGQFAFNFTGRYLPIVMRDISGVAQYLRIWAAKDGAELKPFRELSSQSGNENFAAVGDGLYYVTLIDLGAWATWTLMFEAETAFFGGACILSTNSIAYPTKRGATGLFIGDSFTVPGQAQFRHSLGYIPSLSRQLGVEWHVSGMGGTGYCAKASGGDSLNYAERLPYDVDAYFNDQDPPDVIVVQASQNDRTYGFAGSPDLDDNIAAVLGGLRARFPKTPIFATGIMHTRTETFQDEYFEIEDQIRTYLADNPDLAITYIPGLLSGDREIGSTTPVDPIAYGTGYQGHTVGDGPSDTMTYTDSSHPSAINGTAPTGAGTIADTIADAITASRRLVLADDETYRPFRVTDNIGSSAAKMIASGNHSHSDAIPISRLPSDEVGKRRLVQEIRCKVSELVSGTHLLGPDGAFLLDSGTKVSATGAGRCAFTLDPTKSTVSGKSRKYIAVAEAITFGTAPGGTHTIVLTEVDTPAGAAGAETLHEAGSALSGSTCGQWVLNSTGTFYDEDSTAIAPAQFSLASGTKKRVAVRLQCGNQAAGSTTVIVVKVYAVDV